MVLSDVVFAVVLRSVVVFFVSCAYPEGGGEAASDQ
jgi:uncharacterized oligopeptide transporter (OPT) family protein